MPSRTPERRDPSRACQQAVRAAHAGANTAPRARHPDRVGLAGSLAARPRRARPQTMRVLDPNALGQHLDRLYRAAWALCGSREDAEDLVQETCARVLSRPRVLHGENDLYYLLRVLRNTYLSSRRAAGRRPRAVATLEDVSAADPRPMGRPQEALEVR